MHNSIVLSSCLFGSVYLMSKSLELMNINSAYNKKISNEVIFINRVTFLLSSSVFIGTSICYTVFRI